MNIASLLYRSRSRKKVNRTWTNSDKIPATPWREIDW